MICETQILRSVIINDAIAMEHGSAPEGALRVANELDVNLNDLSRVAGIHAMQRVPEGPVPKEEAQIAVSMAFAMGYLGGLRVTKLGAEPGP